MIHTLRADRYSVSPQKLEVGTKGSWGNDYIKLSLSPEWDGLTVKISFYPSRSMPVVVVYGDDKVAVPAEVYDYGGDTKAVISGETEERVMISLPFTLKTNETLKPANTPARVPTPDEFAQIYGYMQGTRELAQQLADRSAASAGNAAASAKSSEESASAAEKSSEDAKAYMTRAENAAQNAENSADRADADASSAAQSSQNANNYSTTAVNAANAAVNAANSASRDAADAKIDANRADEANASAKAAASAAAISAKEASDGAVDSKASANAAAQSEANAAASETSAAESAQRAQGTVDNAGFAAMEIGEDGWLYLIRTDNIVDLIDFSINNNGVLEAIVS